MGDLIFLWGTIRQINSLMLTRKFQIDCFKILLGEVETVIRSRIKSWFADVGLCTSDSILGLLYINIFLTD